VRDDRVPDDVRNVLVTNIDGISFGHVAGGTVAVAISGDRSMVAVGFADFRPEVAADGRQQIGLLLLCGEESLNLGTFADGFFIDVRGGGWYNSVALSVPDSCQNLVVVHLYAEGGLLGYVDISLRKVPEPRGVLASGLAS